MKLINLIQIAYMHPNERTIGQFYSLTLLVNSFSNILNSKVKPATILNTSMLEILISHEGINEKEIAQFFSNSTKIGKQNEISKLGIDTNQSKVVFTLRVHCLMKINDI